MKKLTPNKKGFTIIEVMIVLAVAGVIMLIVLLAVPALQRSQRNTQRKNDATALLAAVNDFASNNNGVLPTKCTGTTTVTFYTTAASQGSDAKAGYFTGGCATSAPSNGKIQLGTSYTANAGLKIASKDYIIIMEGAACNTTGGSAAGTARSFIALYETENGSGNFTPQCVES